MSRSDAEERTAFHEAGHVVAAYVLDREITRVSLDGPSGATTSLTDDGDEWDRRAKDIVVAYAGPLAEARKFERANAGGMYEDHLHIRREIEPVAHAHRRAMTPEDVEVLRSELAAKALQIVDENWGAVEALALELIRTRTLSGPQVVQLLDRA
jgi:ATP-dependent Zn protease